MSSDIFLITPMDIISWIAFGFVVGLLVNAIKQIPTPKHIVKDIVLAILGSMVAGLTIEFFYGYTMLGALTISIVGGIMLASGYVWILFYRNQQPVKTHVKRPLRKPQFQ